MKRKGGATICVAVCAALGVLLMPMDGRAGNLDQAEKLYSTGRYNEAFSLAKAAVGENNDSVEAHKILIRCYNKTDRLSGALTNYTKLLLSNPKNAVYQFAVAYIYDLKGNTDRAIDGYKKALDLNSKLHLANYNLGWISDDQAELGKAVEYYQKEIDNNPGFEDAYYNLGRACIKMKQYDRAISTAEQLLAVSPDNFKGLNLLGEANYGQGNTERALSAWRRTVSLEQKDLQAGQYNVNGLVFDAKGYYNSAMKEFRAGIEQQGGNPVLHTNLGLTYMHKVNDKIFGKKNDKWIKEAIKEFQKAIELNPKHGDAYVGLGDAYFAMGQNEEGINQYKKYVEIDPRDVNGLNRLGNAYKMIGRYKDAVNEYNKAIKIDPDNAEAYRNLGFAYYYQGLQDAAKAQWEKSLKLDPNQPQLREQVQKGFSKF